MRKCIRCDQEMIENLEINVSNGAYGIVIKEKGLFRKTIASIIMLIGACLIILK